MNKWEIIGIIGIIFATLYKVPQIIKIIKIKRGDDISNKMFVLHTLAYIFILTYQFGIYVDPILISYYFIGISQTLTLIGLKKYYRNNSIDLTDIDSNELHLKTITNL